MNSNTNIEESYSDYVLRISKRFINDSDVMIHNFVTSSLRESDKIQSLEFIKNDIEHAIIELTAKIKKQELIKNGLL